MRWKLLSCSGRISSVARTSLQATKASRVLSLPAAERVQNVCVVFLVVIYSAMLSLCCGMWDL